MFTLMQRCETEIDFATREFHSTWARGMLRLLRWGYFSLLIVSLIHVLDTRALLGDSRYVQLQALKTSLTDWAQSQFKTSTTDYVSVQWWSGRLQGEDKDGNGVRDDLDAWLSKQPLTAEQLEYAQEIARLNAASLSIDMSSNESIHDHLDKLNRAKLCLARLISGPDGMGDPGQLLQGLDDLSFNTRFRSDRRRLMESASGVGHANAQGSNTLEYGRRCELGAKVVLVHSN